jgi:hypothetical protein
MVNFDQYLEQFLDSLFFGLLVAALLVEFGLSRLLFKKTFSWHHILPWYCLFFGIRFILKGVF